jgi:hypothetical protein
MLAVLENGFRGNAASTAFPSMAFSAIYAFKHFSNLFQQFKILDS